MTVYQIYLDLIGKRFRYGEAAASGSDRIKLLAEAIEARLAQLHGPEEKEPEGEVIFCQRCVTNTGRHNSDALSCIFHNTVATEDELAGKK